MRLEGRALTAAAVLIECREFGGLGVRPSSCGTKQYLFVWWVAVGGPCREAGVTGSPPLLPGSVLVLCATRSASRIGLHRPVWLESCTYQPAHPPNLVSSNLGD